MDDTSLQAGRVLDAQIADQIFGIKIADQIFGIKYEFIHGEYCMPDPEDRIAYLVCPAYSTHIAAAFQIEERMQELGLAERYAYYLVETVLAGYTFSFLYRGADEEDIFAVAHALPEQRCRAALKAIAGDGASSR